MTGFACNYKSDIPDVAWNDIYLDETGNLATVAGIDDVEQTSANSIWLNQKEYEYNTTLGIPYKKIFNNVFISKSVIDYYVSNAILLQNQYMSAIDIQTYGIKKVVSISQELNRQTRALNVVAIILLNNGTTIKLAI